MVFPPCTGVEMFSSKVVLDRVRNILNIHTLTSSRSINAPPQSSGSDPDHSGSFIAAPTRPPLDGSTVGGGIAEMGLLALAASRVPPLPAARGSHAEWRSSQMPPPLLITEMYQVRPPCIQEPQQDPVVAILRKSGV